MKPSILSLEDIVQRLKSKRGLIHRKQYPKYHDPMNGIFTEPPRQAAVLIPILVAEEVWQLLFIRRTENLVEHSGQVAFPGGSLESQDSSIEIAAMREAREEIGLQPPDIHILGKLEPIWTITNYLVTPVVGSIPWPYPLVLESREVSRVFTIPLWWLAEPKNYQIVMRDLPAPLPRITTIYYKPYDNEILWGVSAKITQNLIQTLFPEKIPGNRK